jgi:heme A synthase
MRPATLVVALVAVQVTLGALTVLSRRDPWINSFHVVVGAMVLTTSLVLTLRSWRSRIADRGSRIADSRVATVIHNPVRNPKSAIHNDEARA